MENTPGLRLRLAGVVTVSTVALVTGLATVGAAGTATAAARNVGTHRAAHSEGQKPDYDARQGAGAAGKTTVSIRAAKASSRRATQQLRTRLGPQALVEMDGTTGTPRIVARLDGYLTGASKRPANTIAINYVRQNLAALGLKHTDLGTFRLRRTYTDVAGIHHLSYAQYVDGEEVFGNGLQANVTRKGKLLSLSGSPISGLLDPPSDTFEVPSKTAAIAAARKDANEPTQAGSRDTAKPVVFVAEGVSHHAWQVVTMSAQNPALSVIDATTGSVLFRQDLSSDANAPVAKKPARKKAPTSRGIAYRYFPKHSTGGTQAGVNYTTRGWLSGTATKLSGNNSHTYADVNDDNIANPSEEIPPKSPHAWNYPLRAFNLPGVSFCNNPFPCSWDPDTANSWQVNRNQNAAQVFYFVNNWHDHLLAAPIGFTQNAGNFQQVNRSGLGAGGDAVVTQTDDGADTADGLPDGDHIDNANMDTPPDGQAPTMQMYLQHQPGTTYPDGDPFSPTNVGDEADTVYHEYTHGLSHRLVVDATGVATLGPIQGDAMGEAWSDWYAMDYLVAKGLQKDVKGKVDVVLFQYDGEGVALDRTQPMDCKVGSQAAACGGGTTGHLGGYTYADYGNIAGGPEVHADGEIWGETLWDLRDKLGSAKTESLVTRAMELSPSDPSMLDERNAILIADTAVFNGADRNAIWSVFAHRGMGYFAGSLDGGDVSPGADFHTPRPNAPKGTIHGVVTDADSGQPVAGVTVALAFQGAPGAANPAATTAANGSYTLGPVPIGVYPKINVAGAGYDPVSSKVTVTHAGVTKNFVVRRDWAASSGGASISDFNGPDFSPQCGPDDAIDNSQATGWGSTTGDDDGDATNTFVPKWIVIDLPATIDVTGFAVDPAATCGDGGSASVSDYRIETSPDGTTWTEAASGTFTIDDRGVLSPIAPTAGATGVQFVRFTMLGNQTPDFATNCPDGGFSGCSFTDMSEIEVYGAAS